MGESAFFFGNPPDHRGEFAELRKGWDGDPGKYRIAIDGHFVDLQRRMRKHSITVPLEEPAPVGPILELMEAAAAFGRRINDHLELALGRLLELGLEVDQVTVIRWRDEPYRAGVRVDGVDVWEARGDIDTGEVSSRWLADPERFADHG